MHYAHSNEDKTKKTWQTLEEHLKNVAVLASKAEQSFNDPVSFITYVAGILHDIGKYNPAFQKYLESSGQKIDHSTVGAQIAEKIYGKDIGRLLSYIIAGHHSGLPNGLDDSNSCLNSRLNKNLPTKFDYPSFVTNKYDVIVPKDKFKTDDSGMRLMLFIRMLYSCLVDADFLDTEKFLNLQKYNIRKGEFDNLKELNKKLEQHLSELIKKSENSVLNKYRKDVLDSCIKQAKNHKGLFSLTVPTGGGKTLSSLAFALQHAIENNMDRIIYVIPYTSIIEQNAAVFKRILGTNNVVEHHSNYSVRKDQMEDFQVMHNMLATENWDAPIIVTTNVQFFESLYASKSSKCRKLHNIANSVVIFDEVQVLPAKILSPCLKMMKLLIDSYNCSLVLCTATQPAFNQSDRFPVGLTNIKEIIDNTSELFEVLKRVEITNIGGLNIDSLVEKLSDHNQFLCIVNTKKIAKDIFYSLDSKNKYHLSANMCPYHRKKILEEINNKLNSGEECRVVSTQVIEAGVDVDFPVVYRLFAGLDSVIQAAGRCNREGKLNELGKTFVFSLTEDNTYGDLKEASKLGKLVLENHNYKATLEAINEYFNNYFWLKSDKGLDTKNIIEMSNTGLREAFFRFKDVGRSFKLIDDITFPIIIPFDAEAKRLLFLLKQKPTRGLMRALQKFTVSIYQKELNSLMGNGYIDIIQDNYYVLNNMEAYDTHTGINTNIERRMLIV